MSKEMKMSEFLGLFGFNAQEIKRLAQKGEPDSATTTPTEFVVALATGEMLRAEAADPASWLNRHEIIDERYYVTEAYENVYEIRYGMADGDDLLVCHAGELDAFFIADLLNKVGYVPHAAVEAEALEDSDE